MNSEPPTATVEPPPVKSDRRTLNLEPGTLNGEAPNVTANLAPRAVNRELRTVNLDDDIDERSFLRKYGVMMGVMAVVVTCVVVVARQFSSNHAAPPRHEEEITMVKLLAPPPPPPPPPPEIQEQKMIEQTPVDVNEPKPDNKPAPPTPSLGTGIKGDGAADGFGLTGSAGNGYFGGGGNHGSGSRWGWYAAEVQTAIQTALGKNSQTRMASFHDEVRVWLDRSGRVTRVKLMTSTGDPAVDQAIKDNVLNGLQLPDPPPAGMPMPIVMRVTALRPN
jgi:protein TonB